MLEEQVGEARTAEWNAAVHRVTEGITRCHVPLDGLRMRLARSDGRIVARADARAAGRPVRDTRYALSKDTR